MFAARSLNSLYHQFVPVLVAAQMVAFFSSSPLILAKGVEVSKATIAVQQQFEPIQFLELTNVARQTRGLSALALNNQLTEAAKAKATDMSRKGYWDHFRPSDGKAPWAFIEEAGYNYQAAGENLAKGYKTPEGITKAWLASPTHLANIMSPKYTEVGFASIESTDQNGQKVLLTVQMFGSR